jgi:hypothetical protein
MRKTLLAALIVSVGLGGQAYAQSTKMKEAKLSFALANSAQDKTAGVMANGHWSDVSYQFIADCAGTVKYKTQSKPKVTNATIITAINTAMKSAFVGAYLGSFTSKALLVLVDYENFEQAPPYPPNMDLWTPEERLFLGNAPRWNTAPAGPSGLYDQVVTADTNGVFTTNYVLSGAVAFEDYSMVPELSWPAEYVIAWGYMAEGAQWVKTRVFIKDLNNNNPLLRCFDVTPFFSFEEAYCKFCWDTHDRITDGSITAGSTIDAPPCSDAVTSCGRKGSGTTKWYMTVKFNNTIANPRLAPYYFDLFGDVTLGAYLNEAQSVASQNALIFTVGGVVTYKWSYKTFTNVAGEERVTPMGTMSMPTAAGYGQSPFCGIFTGSFSITEVFVNTDSGLQCVDAITGE